jgi:maleate isomerase
LAPQGVSLHFQRMMARGVGGSLDGQSERNQMMIDHLPEASNSWRWSSPM